MKKQHPDNNIFVRAKALQAAQVAWDLYRHKGKINRWPLPTLSERAKHIVQKAELSALKKEYDFGNTL